LSLTISNFIESGLANVSEDEPTVLLLHGFGANERDLVDLMSFLPDHAWASLRAPISLGHGSFAWCGVESPLNPNAAEIAESTNAIWQWVDANVSPDSPLILIGFSQGGLMATQMLRTQPGRVLAAAILAGFVYEGAQLADVQLADAQLAKSKPKVFYGRGSADTMIPKSSVSAINTWLQGHTRAQTKTYDGLGHSIDARMMNDVARYVQELI
jgi:phospholipase/carboxylesterase